MKKLAAEDIRERPAYAIGEAARYLHLNEMTLASWALGRSYRTADGNKRWPALFQIADRVHRRMSFINLVEGNVLVAVRREHQIAIPKIRAALEFVREQLGVSRPLCDQQFETNGVDLFVERYGQLINASKKGQIALREMLQAALRRIEREGPTGAPVRLYAAAPDERDRSKYVAFDPAVAFGRPALVGSGAPVAAIAERFRAGDSIDALAEDYAVERPAIEEAVRQAGLLRAA
jgi:uncharacterized protein (DUF433 family)